MEECTEEKIETVRGRFYEDERVAMRESGTGTAA